MAYIISDQGHKFVKLGWYDWESVALTALDLIGETFTEREAIRVIIGVCNCSQTQAKSILGSLRARGHIIVLGDAF